MPRRTPTTIHLDPEIARAVKIKAAVSGRSLSDLANEGLRRILSEDEADLRIVSQRRKSKTRPYEEFLAELRKNGQI
jgi:hypothetical protein